MGNLNLKTVLAGKGKLPGKDSIFVSWYYAAVVGSVVVSVGDTGAQAVSSKAKASRVAIFTAVVFISDSSFLLRVTTLR